MSQRGGAARFAVNATQLDVGQIAAANATGFYLDHDVLAARGWPLHRIESDIVDTMYIQNSHVVHSRYWLYGVTG